MKKRINPYKTSAIIILVIIIVLFVYSVYNHSSLENRISDSIKSYGLIPILIFSFLFELLPQYISCHILLVIANFFEMDMYLIILSVIIGGVGGSIIGFEIGNRIEESKFLINFIGKEKIKKLEEGINNKGRYIISLAAISPLPYIPLVIGMLHMKRKNFFIYGVIPRIFGMIIIGLLTYGVFI